IAAEGGLSTREKVSCFQHLLKRKHLGRLGGGVGQVFDRHLSSTGALRRDLGETSTGIRCARVCPWETWCWRVRLAARGLTTQPQVFPVRRACKLNPERKTLRHSRH